jgi:hypothetical protein
VLGYEFGNSAVGIVQVPENADLCGARGHTSRFSSSPNQVYTKPALNDNALMLIRKPDLVRAGFNAIFAAHTPFAVNQDHSFGRRVNGPGRAHTLAWSVLALVALERNEFFGKRGEFSALFFFDPVERLVEFQVLLILAGHPAGMAADTLGCINSYSVTWHVRLPQIGLITLLHPNICTFNQSPVLETSPESGLCSYV